MQLHHPFRAMIGLGTLACFFTFAAPASAAGIWDAGGVDTYWSTAANWDNNTIPASGTSLQFGTGGSTATVDSARIADSITFNRSADFTIDGASTLEINGGGITVQDAQQYAITAPFQAETQTWDVATGGALDLQMTANDGGAQTFTKAGAGTVTLDDDATGKHFLAVDAGTLKYDGTDAGQNMASVTVGEDGGSAATFQPTTVFERQSLRTIRASGTFKNTGFVNQIGDDPFGTPGLTMSGGTVQIAAGGELEASGDPATIAYEATANGGQASITGDGLLELRGASFTSRTFDIADKSGLDVEMRISTELTNDANGDPTLYKRGAGTLAIDGDNTHAGPMNVENGTLLINGVASGQGNYTVGGAGQSATLGGNGTVGLAAGNSVTVADEGIIAPGESIGTLTVDGDVSFTDNSTLQIELDASTSDTLTVNGALDLTSTLDELAVTGTTGAAQYTLLNYTGSRTGVFDTTTLPDGYTLSYGSSTNGDITLVIPEPASLSLMALGGLLMCSRRWRRMAGAAVRP